MQHQTLLCINILVYLPKYDENLDHLFTWGGGGDYIL